MKMMKQAASMQKKMQEMQAEIAKQDVEFTSGGGMVKVVAGGDISIKSIQIDPKVIDPEDPEMLEDMVLAAVDGALKEAQKLVSDEMGKVTQGMDLPAGMNLPF
jgi:DNA-binding YbaB/EbfC family protein